MKVNISKSRDFVLVWAKGTVDLYLKPSGNFDTAYFDLKDEDLRILKGLWNHLQAQKKEPAHSEVKKGIEETIQALDRILEERKN